MAWVGGSEAGAGCSWYSKSFEGEGGGGEFFVIQLPAVTEDSGKRGANIGHETEKRVM